MPVQNTYMTAIDQLTEIAQEVDLDEGMIEQAQDYHGRIAEFEVLIPLVGSFNAGKTSLVNAYLQREEGMGLPVDIVPQTALATEIRSASSPQEERIDLYGEDDQLQQRIDIEQFQRFEKETLQTGQPSARYAKAMLYAEILQANNKKVLVDMPGLDSGLRTHNAAIQRYLPLGSFFILVVDADQGTLRESEVRQLREFFGQEIEFAVLINKADKNPIKIKEIVTYIGEQASQEFGTASLVQPVSAHDDIAAFHQIVESIDFDRALRSFWRLRIVGLFEEAIQSLHTRYSALNVSSTENERMIAQLEEDKQALETKLREDEREIESRYSHKAVERILLQVRSEIRDHAAFLAQTYFAGGGQAFERELNELVRQTLNSAVDQQRSESLREIVERYQSDIGDIATHYEQFSSETGPGVEIGSDTIRLMSNRIVSDMQKLSPAFEKAAESLTNERLRSTYLGISGVLAAATTVVAPWLEVVIITAPLILGSLIKKRREYQEQQQEEQYIQQLQSQIASVVAPKIVLNLRDQITESYSKVTQEMLGKLREQVGGAVENIQNDIARSQREIEEHRQDVAQRREQLRSAIERLTEGKRPIENN